MPAIRYRAHELLIQSEIPLLGFAPTTDEGLVDVEVRLGEVSPASGAGLPWQASGPDVCLQVPGIGAFQAKQGREVIACPDRIAPLLQVALPIRSSMMAAILLQRGLVPLHASCVHARDGGAIFLGPVGVGRSTLATALHYNGFPLMNDEMTALRLNAGSFLEVLPAFPEVRLWRPALQAFNIPEEAWGSPIRPSLPKFSLPIPDWQGYSVRPRSVFILSQRLNPAIEIKRLEPRRALPLVYHHVFRSRFLANMPAFHDRVNETLSFLVQNVDCFSLEFPEDLDDLPELCASVAEHLSSPAQVYPSGSCALPRIQWINESSSQDQQKNPGGLAVLASYPKSGNTWMRALLTAWRRETAEAELDSLDGGHPFLLRHHMDELLGADTDYMTPEEICNRRSEVHEFHGARLTDPTVIKIHDLCRCGQSGELLFPVGSVAGVIYVVRNPLDVVSSAMNHFQKNMEETVTMMATKHMVSGLRSGYMGIHVPQLVGSWSGHVNSWLDERSYRLAVVRYEDLLEDTLRELKRVVVFFGLPWDEERGIQVVEKTRFERLQSKEKQRGFSERPIHTNTFFRQGKAGTWRSVVPRSLQRRIVKDHREAMRRVGYSSEVDEVLNGGS